MAAMMIPKGLHLLKAQAILSKEQHELLALGSVAPNWILYDANNKRMSLSEMTGKVILMDFFFIGCGNCMEALKSLNMLHEKYKNQNLAMVSMTFRDSKKSTAEFEKIMT